MTWYRYQQNNSGGAYSDPAVELFVEAPSEDEADERAETVGVYFDGGARGMDCSCCGDRWSRAWEVVASPTPRLTFGPTEDRTAACLPLGVDELIPLPCVEDV